MKMNYPRVAEWIKVTARMMVDYPDDVEVGIHRDGDLITFVVKARDTDMHRLFGKGGLGKTTALKTLLEAMAKKMGENLRLEFDRPISPRVRASMREAVVV